MAIDRFGNSPWGGRLRDTGTVEGRYERVGARVRIRASTPGGAPGLPLRAAGDPPTSRSAVAAPHRGRAQHVET